MAVSFLLVKSFSLVRRETVPEETVRLLLPLGNALCLDFANTVEPRGEPGAFEFLTGYDELVHWAVHLEAIDKGTGRRLRTKAAGNQRAAGTVYGRALALRAAISSVFETIAEQKTPRPSELNEIDRFYKHLLRNARLTPRDDGFVFVSSPGTDLDAVLWPVVSSAVELLTHGDLARVKFCAGDCHWLFLDTSKNHSRRWCTMAACGSRDKMRRHYARHRADPGTA
jgi:predicted RNA-binding Zn ribbon-like protein